MPNFALLHCLAAAASLLLCAPVLVKRERARTGRNLGYSQTIVANYRTQIAPNTTSAHKRASLHCTAFVRISSLARAAHRLLRHERAAKVCDASAQMAVRRTCTILLARESERAHKYTLLRSAAAAALFCAQIQIHSSNSSGAQTQTQCAEATSLHSGCMCQ